MASFSFNLLTLKIKLLAGPLRKITIPDYYTFGDLHQFLMFVWEFDDGHLHRFEVPNQSQPARPVANDPLLMMLAMQCSRNNWTWVSNPMSFNGMQTERNEASTNLSFGFKRVGDKVDYEYDFGAGWRAKIELENIERKNVNVSNYTPGIVVVGGRGKTVPEYDRSGGTKYNKKKLNEELSQMDEFKIYPDSFDVNEDNEEDDEQDQEENEAHQEDDEDSDLEILPNYNHNGNKARRSSVLGKRRNLNVNNFNVSKKRRTR